MDTAQLASSVLPSAALGAPTTLANSDQSVPLLQLQPGSPPSRSPSVSSTTTERPTTQLLDAQIFPRKPPSVDSNFSSVQGKTAGTPPDEEYNAHAQETVSSIWGDSRKDKTQFVQAPSIPEAASTSQSTASAHNPSALSSRPDWMTDDLDESWPEDDAAVQSTPTPTNAVPTTVSAPDVQSHRALPDPNPSTAQSAPIPQPLATPSVASRPPPTATFSNALPDPAFSAARHQARRALLKGRASAAGAPTPKGPLAINNLHVGPSTPSLRIPSHHSRRDRPPGSIVENEEGDSTIWSESESEPESNAASNSFAPDDFESAPGSLAENSRITNVHTAQQSRTVSQQQAQSPTSPSVDSSAKGTFIHKVDASSLPPILRPVWQSPVKGQNGQNRKGITALGGDMFTPMRLQTMFKTPTPPEKPVHNIMSAVATTANPFSIPDVPSSERQAISAEGRGEAGHRESSLDPESRPLSSLSQADAISSAQAAPKSAEGSNRLRPPTTIGVPSTAFTFQSPHASIQAPTQGSHGMVPSQSLQNMQSLHPNNLHVTTLARPASAAADLGLHSPAVAGSANNLLSGPPTPHTPMRLFKFNYDDADTRAKLEKMVNERTPAAAQPPPRPVGMERERKRLRLDVKPRKALTGDLMSMPMLGDTAPAQQAEAMRLEVQLLGDGSGSNRQPVVDYVKESTGFMSALQDAVRVQFSGPDTSVEWTTDENGSSGNAAENREEVSFHEGKSTVPTAVSFSSPVRQRRPYGIGHKRRTPQQRDATRDHVIPSAIEHGSPQRLSSRRLPPDSSFITESSSNDIPMSSTLKSRASLSRRIAAQEKAGESPRKLLRRISAAAIAEDEVMQEFDGQELEPGKEWEPVKLAEDVIAHRDEQIRQLEERIARRRQLYTPAKPSAVPDHRLLGEEPRTVQRPQLITLHEPTLDAISGQRQGRGVDASDDESDVEDSIVSDVYSLQGHPDGNNRRFQDGIVLYDSERIPDPPLPDPTRTLRNIASDVELRNRESDRASLTHASSLLALPTQSHATGATVEGFDPSNRRGDRTASSNTLVDPSVARTVSGDAGSQITISDLGGKGATITRTGSLFNISQIPEQEIESLGRGKLKFNKELGRWEKVPRSRSSQEDLRSAAGSRNDVGAVPTSKTPIPAIPEASVEISRSLDVFSESAEEQQAREQAGARTNSFQQRLGNSSANNLSAADGRFSDSSDPFRDFESFGQSSHAPASVSDVADGEDESTPRPVKSHLFVSNRESRQEYKAIQASTPSIQQATEPVPMQNAQPQPGARSSISHMPATNSVQPKSVTPNALASRTLPTSTVPRSGSSLRNVVTYSPDSTVSSRHSSLGQHAMETRDESNAQHLETQSHAKLESEGQGSNRVREHENVYATPDRRLAHQHVGTPTPRASTSLVSTPKSILKQSAAFRADARALPHNTSANSAAGVGTPNRTISFADPPSTARAHNLGLASSARVRGSGHRARANLGAEVDDVDAGSEDGRTQAISSALKVLADLTLGDDSQVLGPGALSPSKLRDMDSNRSHWSYRTLRRPQRTRHEEGNEDDHSSRADDETYDKLHGYPDMTLLTDASFNFAHDKVLEAITDIEPWEPGWDELQAINLSRRRLESCVRLKEFLPALEEVDLQVNELSYLTGIPVSVRVLNVAQNRLTSMASFGHLLHLEELDVSGNQIDSLSHLSCLKHLHTLKADDNAISSLDGIDKIRSLVHISLSGNRLKGVNLATTQWSGLETLDASHNQLISIRGLSLMRRLKSLNVDHNDLSMVDLSPVMPRLRVLRVSGNVHLQALDVAPAKRLRTLYADYCDLDRIENLNHLEHLDNLSMRQQAEASIAWPADQLRDVRRLFLSGNAFPQGISTSSIASDARKPIAPAMTAQLLLLQPLRFLNLVYLELSACQLMQLPEDLSAVAPNLRSLNLDHNLISALPNLAGMQRLKRLSLVGCRVKKSKSVITAVRGLSELQVLDCRTNPCTLGLYAPLVAPAATSAHRSEDGNSRMEALAPSWLPPVPNAQIVQPDLAARQRRHEAEAQHEQIELMEKSHFHKRRPPLADYAIDPNATLAKEALEKETAKRAGAEGASYSSLFSAADARFLKTLPKQFYERRVLHRGLLAMACPKLNWVDGLLIAEEEIEEADRLVQSRRFDRAPVT